MKIISLNYLFTIVVACLLLSCSSNTDRNIHEHTSAHSGHNHDGEIVISNDDIKHFGIITSKIDLQPFENVVRVTGQIKSNSIDEVIVSAPIAGILSLTDIVAVGADVKSGSHLGLVSTNNVTGGNPNESAKALAESAKKELERLEPLLKEGIVTQKEYNSAMANYQSAKAMYSANANGGLSSPISGVVSEVYVTAGSYVVAGEKIAKISKNSSLMLQADLPERYRNLLPLIESANIRMPYSDEWICIDSLGGKKLTKSSGENISRTGYIPVLFSLKNDGRFSSGSYVDICLISQGIDKVLSVPNEAIVEQQGNYFVFVKASAHSFKKHKVMIGDSNGFRTHILSGINAGDNIVVKGAIMVLLSEQGGNIPHGHSHNH